MTMNIDKGKLFFALACFGALAAWPQLAHATIVDATTVTAAGRTFTARNIVLGMGARPVWPEIPGLEFAGTVSCAGSWGLPW